MQIIISRYFCYNQFMYVALLGRQPEISLAELEAVFGKQSVARISETFATVKADNFNIDSLGGTIKCGKIVKQLALDLKKNPLDTASRYIIDYYAKKWQSHQGKITLGLSVYGLKNNAREVQKIGIILKSTLKKSGTSLRLIPNQQPALSTATSHNNKLGSAENKIELLIIKTRQNIIIAESRGVQNITAYTFRDRNRPKRDAFVGMLPPKLAQIMINLSEAKSQDCLWDPFCGTGTVLQEAYLMNINTYGSDLNPKMVDYTTKNVQWLAQKYSSTMNNQAPDWQTFQADATTAKLDDSKRSLVTHIVCETYLGQPFSAPPAPEKLKEVVGNCNHIISSFLENILPQINDKVRLCIAVPAWQDTSGNFTHLPLLKRLEKLGYKQLNRQQLLYHRPDQVVAREILVLTPISRTKTA